MPDILVRPATLEDAEFLVSGNASMALETEGRALDTHTLRAGVCAVFDDSARGFYMIAEIDGQPAGQMMITYEWSDWRNGAFWWIQSVYVDPAWRRRGVFRRMHETVMATAKTSPNVC